MSFSVDLKEYPVLGQMTYLDTPFQGLIPRSTWDRIHEHTLDESNDFAEHDAYWRHDLRAAITQEMADSLGIEASEVSLVPGFSVGLRELTPWLTKFRKVVLVEDDYPTLIDAFSTGNFEITLIPRNADGSFSLEDLAYALEENKGGILAVSHVHNVSGFRCDIERIGALAKANDVISLVDLTQTFGNTPVNLKNWPIDCTVCSTYKWTGSGFGVGFVTVRKDHAGLSGAIEQLNTGHLDPYAMLRLRYGLSRLMEFGIERIKDHVDLLSDELCDGLVELGVELISDRCEAHRSVIIQFAGSEELQKELMTKGVRTSYRGNGIRIGLHWYNTKGDVQKLIAALS